MIMWTIYNSILLALLGSHSLLLRQCPRCGDVLNPVNTQSVPATAWCMLQRSIKATRAQWSGKWVTSLSPLNAQPYCALVVHQSVIVPSMSPVM